jgi:hypothetical protein
MRINGIEHCEIELERRMKIREFAEGFVSLMVFLGTIIVIFMLM